MFIIIMIPNFIWFAVPAPNDILRADSITKAVDTAGSACQVLMPPRTEDIVVDTDNKNIREIVMEIKKRIDAKDY